MKLEVAIVVPGSETLAGDGITGAMRCVLILSPTEQLVAAAFSTPVLGLTGSDEAGQ